jgi:hypothetical protein
LTENRRHPRSQVRLDVELAFPGGRTEKAMTRDLSVGGFFVELKRHELSSIGTPLTVTFLSSPHHSEPYTLHARVQRQTPDGIAMTFIDFSLDNLQFIEALLLP